MNEETLKLQNSLKSDGFDPGPLDGIMGPKTKAAMVLRDKSLLIGDGTWPWHAKIDGDDIVIIGARGTCFGGSNDPQDSGETASGILTKGNPNLKACALPLIYTGKSKAQLKALGGSPLPKVPWKTMVRVTAGSKSIEVPVIDLGPAKHTGNAIDLTIAAARFFDPRATATRFEMRCDVRIIGGAKFVNMPNRATA